MTEELKVSPVDDFRPPRRLVRLPDPGARGTELVIELEYCHPAELLPLAEGLPGIDGGGPVAGEAQPNTIAETLRIVRESTSRLQRIAQRVVMAPEISYGETPEPGKVWWGHLTQRNQKAIWHAALVFTSMAVSNRQAEDRGAVALARFPDEAQGLAVGAGAGGRGEDAAGAATPDAAVLDAGRDGSAGGGSGDPDGGAPGPAA